MVRPGCFLSASCLLNSVSFHFAGSQLQMQAAGSCTCSYVAVSCIFWKFVTFFSVFIREQFCIFLFQNDIFVGLATIDPAQPCFRVPGHFQLLQQHMAGLPWFCNHVQKLLILCHLTSLQPHLSAEHSLIWVHLAFSLDYHLLLAGTTCLFSDIPWGGSTF